MDSGASSADGARERTAEGLEARARTRAFVERQYLDVLGKASLKRLLGILRRDPYELQPEGRDADVFNAVAKMHVPRLRVQA